MCICCLSLKSVYIIKAAIRVTHRHRKSINETRLFSNTETAFKLNIDDRGQLKTFDIPMLFFLSVMWAEADWTFDDTEIVHLQLNVAFPSLDLIMNWDCTIVPYFRPPWLILSSLNHLWLNLTFLLQFVVNKCTLNCTGWVNLFW